MTTHVLLINCQDQKGLVYKVTNILYNKYGLNIISNAEFVDRSYQHFFMRTEFSGDFDEKELQVNLYEVLPGDVQMKLSARRKKNIVLLATKEHHCLSDLLVRHAFNDLDANILAVISNYEVLADVTSKFEVPYHFISHEEKSREAHEAEILEVMAHYQPEFLVLAKYMRILSAEFISRFENRIVNIHHSFLPAFVGANPYAQAFDRGVKIIGATAHFVNNELDQGPIIAQNVIPVDHTYSAKEMARLGRDVEKNVLARSLKLVLNEQVFVYRNKTIIFE